MKYGWLFAILFFVTLPLRAETPKKKAGWLKKLSTTLPSSKGSADVAGVRGLDESDVKVVGSSARDFAAMDELEALEITEDELNQFAAEEGLK